MATVIERLVIQGNNPLGSQSPQPGVPQVRSTSPRRRLQGKTPPATPIGVPAADGFLLSARKRSAGGSLPASLLTISSKCPLESRTSGDSDNLNKGIKDNVGKKPPQVEEARPVGSAIDEKPKPHIGENLNNLENETNGTGSETDSLVKEEKENSKQPKGKSVSRKLIKPDMKTDALPPGGSSPMIRKMEYLALVRQARQGMSATDHSPRRDRGKSGSSDNGRFVIEGRPAVSRGSATSCRSSISSQRSIKKTAFITNDVCGYNDSEVSSIGDAQGEFRHWNSLRRGPGSVRSVPGSVRSIPGSVRSFQSESRLFALPTLTRGSSEPAVCVNDTNWAYKKARRTIDPNAFPYNPDFDELTAVANNLLMVRQQFRSAPGNTERGRNSKPTTPRLAASDTRADELKACLNVSGQPNPAVESPRSTGSKWPPPKHRLPHKKPVSSSSERALLYKRHKQMERMHNSQAMAHKYQFNSVESYLNFNKVNPTPPTSLAPSADQVTVNGQTLVNEPDLRKSVISTSSASISASIAVRAAQKRVPYKAETTIITDLNEYFMVKSPKYGPKHKQVPGGVGVSPIGNTISPTSNNLKIPSRAPPRAPAPTPRTPTSSIPSQSRGVTPRIAANDNKTMEAVKDAGQHVSALTADRDTDSKGKPGAIVSVPSADNESIASSRPASIIT